MPLHHSTWADNVRFIDYRTLDWEQVKRIRYFCYQRFHYAYPGPIHNLHQRLVMVPADRYGDQHLCDRHLTVTPYPAESHERTDKFGNRVWELHIPHIEKEIAFESMITVERSATRSSVPRLTRDQAAPFLQATELTASDAHIEEVARELKNGSRDGYALAERISEWVSQTMQYRAGVTNVATTASQALALGQGLCQDYAHVMLALCRTARLPARYVSGHMLAEGGSHAWVEVLLPDKRGVNFYAHGFDPTNRCRPDLRYTIVAVGRDYRDVAPTSGSYTAPYSGRLSSSKRAGLTLVELADGEIVAGR